jgi:hypothetical protein
MPSYVYNPDYPLANENGMALKDSQYYYWLSSQKEDKRMMNGNQPVEFRFISDGMGDYTRHMCDGKYYDSKSKFRQVTKQYGCVEVGNSTSHLKKRIKTKSDLYKEKKARREDIKRAVWELKNGRDIVTEVKEQIHKANKLDGD